MITVGAALDETEISSLLPADMHIIIKLSKNLILSKHAARDIVVFYTTDCGVTKCGQKNASKR